MSASEGKDGVIGGAFVDSRGFWVLRFRLMVERGPWVTTVRFVASSTMYMSAIGTSRHFAAPRNLVAIGA